VGDGLTYGENNRPRGDLEVGEASTGVSKGGLGKCRLDKVQYQTMWELAYVPLSISDDPGFSLSLTDNFTKLSTYARFLEAELPSPCPDTTAQYHSGLGRVMLVRRSETVM
jgi:hypothetical protein